MNETTSQTGGETDIAANIARIQSELERHFRASVDALKSAIAAFVADGTLPPEDAAARGLFDYPALRVIAGGTLREGVKDHNLSFGRIDRAGEFTTTITRPDLFSDYIAEQLDLILRHYDVRIEVTGSGQQIPFPYVLDPSGSTDMGGVAPLALARHFPTTELADIGDELADGLFGS